MVKPTRWDKPTNRCVQARVNPPTPHVVLKSSSSTGTLCVSKYFAATTQVSMTDLRASRNSLTIHLIYGLELLFKDYLDNVGAFVWADILGLAELHCQC